MSEYKLKDTGIQSDTEHTSAISTISYEIENGLFHGLSSEQITKQLEKLQQDGKFPYNLQIVDAFYDPKTSLSGVAFKDKTTGRVTIGMAGTNLDNGVRETLADLGADASIAFNGPTTSSTYFVQGNQFIENIKMRYPVEAITGHSKGGRDVVVLGVANNIPTIVTYNPAPVTHDFLHTITTLFIASPLKMWGRSSDSFDMKKQFADYRGTIVHLASSKDMLTRVSDFGRAFYVGGRHTLNNGEGHAITGFLGKNEQGMIKDILAEQTQLGQIVGEEMAEAVTHQRLNELFSLKQTFMQNSGGKLSSSQEIYLDAAEAEILTEGMKYAIQEDLRDFKKMYEQEIQDAEDLWKETLEGARILGSNLSEHERLDSLARGGATVSTILEKPKSKAEESLHTLTDIEKSYDELLAEIREAIDTQVEADQDLARQLGII